MLKYEYSPPLPLRNGITMTSYVGLLASHNWENTITDPEPPYHEVIFSGFQDVPIFGWVAIPPHAHSTIVATYGITGQLTQQWILKILGRKAYSQGFAVVLFDWRAHGKTAELSPTLTSDGLYEGEDFVKIAQGSAKMGCPQPFWFTGYSLGGQLALWGVKASASLATSDINIAGGAVICPSLDSERSLKYLVTHPFGKYMDYCITQELKKLAQKIHSHHPESIDIKVIERANSIWTVDQELVIQKLGFDTVSDYYQASSGLKILPNLHKPTLIIYAADDPLFDPELIPEIENIAADNPDIDLLLTRYGGHVGYISSKKCQQQYQDPDQWWAWNRILEWFKNRN
ncbi:alpha/beta fold hydrolase [Anabaena sp. FACHB-1237]|uniref:YheT family hydrolase n=1 Tax=Anabaena sp. FACHB-1237 TaxID=2692769 RepID=UPI0016818CB0|nr:alpha/beta fold hydrolase [Anabaena sp. FACHB-1237]MBD2139320.1 alpha/beta fold hydrolase [Anabaena sp. FACHB-1237]